MPMYNVTLKYIRELTVEADSEDEALQATVEDVELYSDDWDDAIIVDLDEEG